MTQPMEALARLQGAEFKAVGSNQTAKAIGKGRAQIVFVAQDADRRVIEGVLTAARERGLEVIEIASTRDLGRACGIAVGAAAAAVLLSPQGRKTAGRG